MTDPKTIDEKLLDILHFQGEYADAIRDIKAVFELKMPTEEEIQIIYNKRGILHAIEYFLTPEYQTSPPLAEPKREIKVGDRVIANRDFNFEKGHQFYNEKPYIEKGKEYEVRNVDDVRGGRFWIENSTFDFGYLDNDFTLVQPSQNKQEKMEEVTLQQEISRALVGHTKSDVEYYTNNIMKLVNKHRPTTPQLIPVSEPKVGQEVWIKCKIDSINNTDKDCYLIDYKGIGVKGYINWHHLYHLPPSPATELQSLLKDPNDLARVIEIFKQLEK